MMVTGWGSDVDGSDDDTTWDEDGYTGDEEWGYEWGDEGPVGEEVFSTRALKSATDSASTPTSSRNPRADEPPSSRTVTSDIDLN